jgi:TRAP-type C4-dicarboxylate transport system permease small subunit
MRNRGFVACSSSCPSPSRRSCGGIAWYSIRLTFQSWQFNDISTGNDATPLWIPQLAMGIGTTVLLIAFADELVLEWRGQRRARIPDEALHHE